jgi:hypothetical protein
MLVSKVAYHHFCLLPFLTTGLLTSAHTQREATAQEHGYWELWVLKGHLSSSLSHHMLSCLCNFLIPSARRPQFLRIGCLIYLYFTLLTWHRVLNREALQYMFVELD